MIEEGDLVLIPLHARIIVRDMMIEELPLYLAQAETERVLKRLERLGTHETDSMGPSIAGEADLDSLILIS